MHHAKSSTTSLIHIHDRKNSQLLNLKITFFHDVYNFFILNHWKDRLRRYFCFIEKYSDLPSAETSTQFSIFTFCLIQESSMSRCDILRSVNISWFHYINYVSSHVLKDSRIWSLSLSVCCISCRYFLLPAIQQLSSHCYRRGRWIKSLI